MKEVLLSNKLIPEEYLELISVIGWKSLTHEQVKKAIDHSMCVVKATVGGKFVGMGRLVGDFGCHGMLADIIVHPDFQGMGIGTKIVMDIKKQAMDMVKPGERFIIELCPSAGKRDFYLKCGFKYKPENMDGMYLWIEKDLHGSAL